MSLCNESKPYIFISYSHRDTAQVYPIIKHMMEAGYNIWYDEGIDPGTEWDENIAKHVKGCSYFIAFISNNYIGSKNCKDELNYSRDEDKNQLLLYLEDVNLPDGMAMRMNRIQAIYWNRYPNKQEAYQKLFSAKDIHVCNMNIVAKPAGTAAPAQSSVVMPQSLRAAAPQTTTTQHSTTKVPNLKKIPVKKIVIGALAAFGGFALFCVLVSSLSGGSDSKQPPESQIAEVTASPTPTVNPTPTPTVAPSEAPTEAPTAAPTADPTAVPTQAPVATDTDGIYSDYVLNTDSGTLTLRIPIVFADITNPTDTYFQCVSYNLTAATEDAYTVELGFQLLGTPTTEVNLFSSRYYTYYESKAFKSSKTISLKADGSSFREGEVYYSKISVPKEVKYVHFFTGVVDDGIKVVTLQSPYEGDSNKMKLYVTPSIGSTKDPACRVSIDADTVTIETNPDDDTTYKVKFTVYFSQNTNNAVKFSTKFELYDTSGSLMNDFDKVYLNLYGDGYDKENKDTSNCKPFEAGITSRNITLTVPRTAGFIRFLMNTEDGFDIVSND